MKKFHKSQRDPNPSRRVNPGLEKGYPARRVDPGWLLRSCKHLLQIDCTRVDPLRRVEVNPGSCKGGLKLKEAGSYESNICTLFDLFDKAVAEGARPNTVKTRSEPYDETEI